MEFGIAPSSDFLLILFIADHEGDFCSEFPRARFEASGSSDFIFVLFVLNCIQWRYFGDVYGAHSQMASD